MNDTSLPLLCVGSVLWDIIGRSPHAMGLGSDEPGRIQKIPGGVALNIAMALRAAGAEVALLSCVGRDADGVELLAELNRMGMITEHLHISADHPTDRYMAIECGAGVVGAIADAHSLETAGAAILAPLANGALGTADAPFAGNVVLDGNLTKDLLAEITNSPLFAKSFIHLAPASPGKAARLKTFLGNSHTTFYVNKEEAQTICDAEFADTATAANTLIGSGLAMAVVTDGANPTSVASRKYGTTTLTPRPITVKRFTGAGDTLMANFVMARTRSMDQPTALGFALEETAKFMSSEELL